MNLKNTLKKTFLYKLLLKYRKGNLYFKEYNKRKKIVENKSPEALIRYVWNKRRRGFPLNLENPKSYQEKMQWLKLNWHTELAIQCASKYLVRQYVRDKGFGFLLNDLYGAYKTPEEIDFSKLPDKFVLKTSHDSAHVIICKDKSKLNVIRIKRNLRKWLNVDYQFMSGEWCYAGEKYIICEKYLENNEKDGLIDFKLLCFNGKFEYLFVTHERYSGNKQRVWYDKEWNSLGIKVNDGSKSEKIIEKPSNFDEMIKYAEILSKPFPFVRVDFYNLNNKIIFGELTFASDSGFNSYYPTEFEFKLGNKLKLPQKSKPTGWEILLNE